MKYIIILMFLSTLSVASIKEVSSFEADFTQSITDDKNKTLVYSGHIIALKPQKAFWNYLKPVKKTIYINNSRVTIIEPEIEQVIVRHISSDIDIFKMIKNAKEVKKDIYLATYKDVKFNITIENKLIKSISYKDEFDNKIKILFTNQIQNHQIDKSIFLPTIPLDYDIIRD